MKKACTLLLIMSVLLGCRKENGINDLKTRITGTWELEQFVCGECPTPFNAFPPGNGNIIVLSRDGTFERRNHDSLVFRGTYTLQKTKECNESLGDIAFYTNETSNATPYFITIESNKLQLSTPTCYLDGAVSLYARIK